MNINFIKTSIIVSIFLQWRSVKGAAVLNIFINNYLKYLVNLIVYHVGFV